MVNQKYNLIKIIYYDLCIYGKLQLLLLVLVIISSLSIIFVTYNTRNMVIEREKFLLYKDMLEIEWRNLIFQEKILSDHDRIERIATNKLSMCYIDCLTQEDFLD